MNWYKLCKTEERGSLGLRNFADISKTYGIKLWWRFRESKSLWSHALQKKYCNNKHPLEASLPPNCSKIWRLLQSIKVDAGKHIFWIVGRGEIDAQKDRWLLVTFAYVLTCNLCMNSLFPLELQMKILYLMD